MKGFIFVSGMNKDTLWKIFTNENSLPHLCHSIERPLDLKYYPNQLYAIKNTTDNDEIKDIFSKEDAKKG